MDTCGGYPAARLIREYLGAHLPVVWGRVRADSNNLRWWSQVCGWKGAAELMLQLTRRETKQNPTRGGIDKIPTSSLLSDADFGRAMCFPGG